MISKQHIAATLLTAITACGRPASDIVHAPERPEDDQPNRGNLDNTSGLCVAGQVLITRNNQPSVCVKQPEARLLSSASMVSFWNNSTSNRCDDVQAFVLAFQRMYMHATISLSDCRPVTTGERAIFVNMQISGEHVQHTQTFEIAASRNESALIRICTSERTRFIENRHCSETFRPNQLPASLAAIAPEPDEAFLDFYPTLWNLLSN